MTVSDKQSFDRDEVFDGSNSSWFTNLRVPSYYGHANMPAEQGLRRRTPFEGADDFLYLTIQELMGITKYGITTEADLGVNAGRVYFRHYPSVLPGSRGTTQQS